MATWNPRVRVFVGGLVVLALAETAWLAYPAARNLILPPRDNPAQRGRALAAETRRAAAD